MSNKLALRLYREFVRYAKLLPQPKRDETFNEARTAFRNNRNESDPTKLEELLKVGNSKLSFLKVITPRKRGASDKGKFVLENGQWVRDGNSTVEKHGQYAVLQNEVGMGELIKRNNALVARQRRAGL